MLHAALFMQAWLATRAMWHTYQRVKGLSSDDSSIRVGMELATQNIQQVSEAC